MAQTYFFIAGEVSGDLHAAQYIRQLQQKDSSIQFMGMGGNNMQNAGCRLVRHINDMAFMGVFGVLKNFGKIKDNFRIAKEQLLKVKPDTLVLVDYPTFNLKMAAWCKQHLPNTQIIYFIPPKVWAWKRWRVHKIGRVTDKILCIFPFEVDFYKQYGYKATYIGNPTMHEIVEQGFLSAWKDKSTEEACIAILPGSRKHEIEKCLPRMLNAALRQSGYKIVVAAMSNIGENFYKDIINNAISITNLSRISLVFDSTYEIVRNSVAAVVCSGTATLETALIGCPQVAVYQLHVGPLLYQLKPLVFKIPYFTLVNIILDKEAIKEWMAYQFTTDNVANDLKDILSNPARRQAMLHDYELLRQQLSGTI